MSATDELAGALSRRLAEVRGTEVEVSDLRRLTGGASRETWSFLAGDERMVLQRQRVGGGLDKRMSVEATLLRAAEASGVPVPRLIDAGDETTELAAPYLLSEFVEAETIARKIIRDDEFAAARASLASECGAALAGIHAMDPDAIDGLEATDQLAQYREILDGFGDPHPVFEMAFRWLEANRPAASARTVVHGDFRLGNLMLDANGLRAVVDWELAHIGDPMEDLGWLCVRAWRFGAPEPVAGIGSYDDLFSAYEATSGLAVDREAVRWWEVLGTLKWGVICIMQSRAHLDGHLRSMELASIGRRVCENEHDLLVLLAPDAVAAATAGSTEETPPSPIHGRPNAPEVVEAIREWVVDHVRPNTTGPVAFHTRVAENLLSTLERELALGPAIAAQYEANMASIGMTSLAELAAAIRSGTINPADEPVAAVLAETSVGKLRVANPRWLLEP